MQQHHHHHQKQHPHNGLSRDSFSPPPASDSSFSSVVVDIDAIELEKENIQPLRQGRSAQTLTRLFTTQHDDRAQQQAAMHGRFQAELSHTDDLDDPMDVYSRYVKWMIENYPQSAGQGHDSQLSPVLERALADFKDDQRYRNDPRFVKLLIIYSEKITNTIELFNFMEANGIGSEIAMYYEEFADFLESREE
jgi:checkpoint serine/threonine-protein kinase